MSLGDFNTNDFMKTKDETAALLVWLLATLTMLVVLLNMLIAVMGDTFNRVQASSDGSMLMEITSMMQENAFLLNRAKKFGRFRYIFVISAEKARQDDDSWERRL